METNLKLSCLDLIKEQLGLDSLKMDDFFEMTNSIKKKAVAYQRSIFSERYYDQTFYSPALRWKIGNANFKYIQEVYLKKVNWSRWLSSGYYWVEDRQKMQQEAIKNIQMTIGIK